MGKQDTKRLSNLQESQEWYVMELGSEPKKWDLNINLDTSFFCLKFFGGSPGLLELECELFHHLPLSPFPALTCPPPTPGIYLVLWTHQITCCPGMCHVISYIMPLHAVFSLPRTLFLLFSPGCFYHVLKMLQVSFIPEHFTQLSTCGHIFHCHHHQLMYLPLTRPGIA